MMMMMMFIGTETLHLIRLPICACYMDGSMEYNLDSGYC